MSGSTEITPSPTPTRNNSPTATRTPVSAASSISPPQYELPEQEKEKEREKSIKSDDASTKSSGFRQGGDARKRHMRTPSRRSSHSYASDDDKPRHNEADWGIGDDARMGLE